MTEERRLVTVVFADVVDSTALGESLDAEDIRLLMRSYYAIAKDVVAAYGGTIEKFIGDAVMCVFGLPTAHGDDAERALYASLELRDRVRADANLSDLKLRFGVCSGEVVAARAPGADFLVTGDAVNLAARLQQAAAPWSILASERTLSAVAGFFELGPRLQIAVKGKRADLAAREVRQKLAPGAVVRRPRAAMRGRDHELEQLALVARRALRDKRPACITIIAPAGTGKSRLLEEFLIRDLTVIAPNATIAVAQCLPYGNQLTYWPLRQVLFRLAGTSEDAGAAGIRDRISSWLNNARYAELLATSIGYGLGDAPDRSDVYAAWRYALEKASNAQPLALIFEDLHWSSESLLDLVDFVMQAHGDAPILMLALARPELIDRRSGWGGGRRNFSNLFLEPLTDYDMRPLVQDLIESAAPATVDAVVARAGGNPFYAEELARSVLERGDVQMLPDTVQASIQARLDLLPADELRILQIGSIFGRTFRLSGVVALLPDLGARIEALTERLLGRDVVIRDDDDHLTFAHILIREVAYQALTRAERARLHAAAGAWLESRAEGRESAVAELLAFHYREAVSLLGRQRLVSVDEADLKRKAVRWLSRAGDSAAAAGAQLEASRHFRAAIDLAREDELPELYERLGDVEQLRLSSIEAYGKALELGRRARRPATDELRVLGGLLMCVLRWPEGVGRLQMNEIDRMLSGGRALAKQVQDARSLARFYAVESFYPWHVRREGGQPTPEMIHTAEASGHRALALAEKVRDWNTWSAAVDGIGSCFMERHDWAGARATAQLRLDRQYDLSVLERMDAYHVVGWMSFLLADPAHGERSLRDSASLFDYAQSPSMILALLADRMQALLLLGRWDEVRELGDQMLRIWNESQEAIGPARLGFMAGLDVARARRDATRASHFREVLLQLAPNVPSGDMLSAYAESDLSGIEQSVLRALKRGWGRPDTIERALSFLNDQGCTIADSTITAVTQDAWASNIPLLQAQRLRAQRDYASAAEIFASAGALPYEARARIELARKAGIAPETRPVAILRDLGDIEYLEAHQLSG